jgi:hypothetical protein
MLKALSNIAKDPDLGVLAVDLSDVAGEGAIFRFREPKAADIFPDAKELGAMRVAFPEFPDPMLYQIYLIARTYIPGQEDDGESPVRAFGNLARASKAVFFRILGDYTAKFPLDAFEAKVDEAKNDSAE